MSSREKIKKIDEVRSLVLKDLLQMEDMIPGSYSSLFTKCGKPNCWCSEREGEGHPIQRITWTEEGVAKTKTIPKEDVEWIIKVTNSYRTFRKFKRKIKQIEALFKLALDKYEKDLIKQTRKLRNYL